MMELVTWTPSFVLGFAEASTGCKGYEALQRFAKQLALGAIRDVGTEDLAEVYIRPLLKGPWGDVLVAMTFINEGGMFRWVFTHSWMADPTEWKTRGCVGLVLIGMAEDSRFFYVEPAEVVRYFEGSDPGNWSALTYFEDDDTLKHWENAWERKLEDAKTQ